MILEVVYSETGVRERVKIPGDKCVIGRSSKADHQIDLECFSRNHFQIEWVNKEFYLTDLNSTNGIYVNNERLPSGVKVLFKNFFPIEVGGKVSISVFTDDSESDSPSSESTPRPSTRSSTDSGQTRTKVVASNRKPIGKKSSSSSSGTPKNFFKPIIFATVLGGMGYYFFDSYQGQTDVPAAAVQPQGNQKPHLQISSDELSKLPDSSSCIEFGSLCNDLGLIHSSERIATSSDKIFVFVNTQEQISKLNSTYMQAYPVAEQTEYFLAYIAFNPKLVAEARKNSFKQIVVVNVISIGDMTKARNTYVLETSNMPALDEEGHQKFFSNLFYAGYHRPYKVHLKSFAEFTSI